MDPKSCASASSATSAKQRSGSLAKSARAKKKNLQDDLPDLLIRCRAERGLSLADVSKAVHLTAMALSKIETRRTTPFRVNRLRLVQFLHKHGYFPKEES